MAHLQLTVLSLRYSSWSMRAWLALTQAGADFETETAEIEDFATTPLEERRKMGSITGLFPVLRIDGAPVHESLAISEFAAEAYPEADLWPRDTIARAQARSYCAEMASGFGAMRSTMSCHLFARVPDFEPNDATRANIGRVLEIWTQCLDRHGGPFLFGTVSIADLFFYPVLTRFRTYSIGLDGFLEGYARAIEDLPAVRVLVETARTAPRNALYDDYVRGLGGDPAAAEP